MGWSLAGQRARTSSGGGVAVPSYIRPDELGGTAIGSMRISAMAGGARGAGERWGSGLGV
jgi:hypothetical protein